MPVKELKIDLMPHLKKIQFKARRDVLNRMLEGNWSTIFKGEGLEFAGYRAYTYGDDASKIDWGASLRAHETLVRELEEYHNFNIFFLIDVSNSMLFSSTGKLKAEYAAELTFSLCYAMMQTGDAIGLGLFTDRLIAKVAPSQGKGVYYRIMRELINPKNYGGNFDFTRALQYVRSFLKERSVIVIISDFIGLKEGWHRYINILSRMYDIIAIMVRDPRDSVMPLVSGQYLIEDPYSNERIYIDSHQYMKRYAAETRKEEEFIRSSFEKAKLGFVSLKTDEDFQEPIVKYFRKRLAVVK